MALLSEPNRAKTIRDELQHSSGDRERHRIPWKGTHELCDVIRLSTDAVVLNPRSHRLRAQLASHPDREVVYTNPTEAPAQLILTELIQAEEGYDNLKANLQEEGQRDPGVITRNGVLVNGNRRAVALRNLGEQYIRVAVLPTTATEREIAELELQLQMTREFKQDYTFTNQLLFVDELSAVYRYSLERIALMLRYAQSSDPQHLRSGIAKVEQAIRILAMIKEIQAISEDRIGYADFDDQRVSLEELDRAYEKLVRDDPEAADRLRFTRFIGVILDCGYKVLRQIDAEFFEEYLAPDLSDDEELTALVPIDSVLVGTEAPGGDDLNLDILSPEPQEADNVDPQPFLTWIAALDEELPVPSTGDARISVLREQVQESVRRVLEGAAERRKLERARERAAEAPGNRLKEATAKIKRAEAQLKSAMEDPTFDQNDFKYKVNKLNKAVRDLTTYFAKIGGR